MWETGKFGLGILNDAGQRLIEFFQENTLVIANTLFQQHKRRLYPRSEAGAEGTELAVRLRGAWRRRSRTAVTATVWP